MTDELPEIPVEISKRRALSNARLVPQEMLDRQGFHPGDFWLGRTMAGRSFGWHEDMNLLTCAGPRAGKGVGVVVPNLLTFEGSTVVIDPKGELATLTAKYRRDQLGQKVVVLDPAGVAKVPEEMRGSYNPMAHLHSDNARVVSDASALANGIVVPKPDAKEPFWDDTALNFIQAVILYMSVYHPQETRTLTNLRQLCSIGDMDLYKEISKRAKETHPDFKEDRSQAFDAMLEDMFACDAYGGIIREAAGKIMQMGENTRGNVLSGLRTHLDFLNEPMLRDVVQGSSDPDRTFRLEELRDQSRGTTVYLCLPVDMMHMQGRWMRLVMMQIMRFIERTDFDKTRDRPLLMMIDEFYQLGRMPSIVNSLTYAPGFGLRIWLIIQDIGQLKALYPNEWTTIMGACGIQQFFGVNDELTAKYVSEMLGEEEIEVPSISISANESATEGVNSSVSRGTNSSTTAGTNWSETHGTSQSTTEGESSTRTLGTSQGTSVSSGVSENIGWSESKNGGFSTGTTTNYSTLPMAGPGSSGSKSGSVNHGTSSGSSGGSSASRGISRQIGTSSSVGQTKNTSKTYGSSQSSTNGGSYSETFGKSLTENEGTNSSTTGGRTFNITVNKQVRKIFRPEEVRLAFTKQNLTQLTYVRDQGGMVLFRTPYYADPFFVKLLESDSDE